METQPSLIQPLLAINELVEQRVSDPRVKMEAKYKEQKKKLEGILFQSLSSLI
jgi:hypothetical protein